MRKTRHILSLALAVITFTACSQDETDTLPDNKQPLTLTATISGGADTRATVNGTWTDGDEVALWIQDGNGAKGIYHYKVSNTGVMTGNYYWQDETVPLIMRAVYPYRAVGEGKTDLSDILWSVGSNQNENNGYANSDLLCSNQADANNGNVPFISFYHQTAKVMVNVVDNDFMQAIASTPNMTINGVILNGTFTPSTSVGDYYGTWKTDGSETSIIIPRMATATGEYAATFEALVIPQTISGGVRLFEFKVGNGYDSFYYTVPTDGITWNPGYEYVYTITIKAEGLEVTMNEGCMNWTTGNTGSGSVTLP